MASTALPTIRERLQAMSTIQKIVLVLITMILAAFIIVFFAYEKQVFELLEPAVDYVRKSSAGIAVLAAIMAATCIFPLFGKYYFVVNVGLLCYINYLLTRFSIRSGYGVVSMICGYVYGIPKGLYRFAFNNYFSRRFKDNIEFREMSKAVSKDGIFILFLIRLSSFPFAALNAYFGSMTQLPYWKFILATTLSTPRLFLPIFIGHNISSLADPTLTGRDRTLKWIANIAGIIIALAVGWYIYRHTTRRIERINAGLSAEEGEAEEQEVENERSTRPAHYDAVVNMEEIEHFQGPASSPTHSSSTIAVVDGSGHKSEIV
ncbi:Tlg2-vesicle protein [Mortierella sp. AM989]|nr:Tlg2-vesicle protein [Mortierella sp. AM989]